MGFLASAIARKTATSPLDLFREIYGGRMSSSGNAVNLRTALGISSVFGCSRLIGNGMAQIPLKLMREVFDGKRMTRAPATAHSLYDVLGRKPNPWQTSFEFRQVMSWHAEICGNFYAFKNAPLGVVRELIPLLPSEVKVMRADDMSLSYEVTSELTGSKQVFPAEAIWHVRGPSWNSWIGIDWLQMARNAIGLSMALEESVAALHKNGVRTTGAWSVDGTLKEGQYAALREWIEREHVGAAATGKPMIIDRAGKWVSSQMTAIDAQHREMRSDQIEEVCRFFGVLPIMLGHSSGGKANTYASAEQMFLAHQLHTLAPRWQMYEQSMDAYLLTDKERAAGYYCDFVEEGMIRGLVTDTKDVLLGYVNGGILTPNEARAKLDLNPDDDPESDELRIPVNVSQAPVDQAPDPNEPPDPEGN